MRLLCGVLAGQRFAVTLTGDASLTRRPMRRVTEPLARMGARIESSPGGTAPLHILPSDGLKGIDYVMPVASAQVKPSLLLAGLYAAGETCVGEPAPTRDHTERMLRREVNILILLLSFVVGVECMRFVDCEVDRLLL
jgi:3-phosphoshikimate 1-carboxyvinyltransferase